MTAEPTHDWRRPCTCCGEPLGAFEPVVVVTHEGRATTTSLTVALALPREPEPRGLFHEECFRRSG